MATSGSCFKACGPATAAPLILPVDGTPGPAPDAISSRRTRHRQAMPAAPPSRRPFAATFCSAPAGSLPRRATFTSAIETLDWPGPRDERTEFAAAVAEIRRLKTCISDLISVLAVPARSSGREPPAVIDALLDVLVGVLQPDFVHVVFEESAGATPVALTRVPQSRGPTALAREIRQAIDGWLHHRSQTSSFVVQGPRGDRDVSIAPLRLGLQDQIGWLLVGSRRADFPTQTDRLLMAVAANQAAIGIHEARLLSEQKRVARELDQRVAQRTTELRAANDELTRALKEIDGLKDAMQRENLVQREQVSIPRGGLTPWQVRRAKQLMHANLDEKLPLSRLAQECELSVSHFARAFRQSTGIPPHRWHLNQRVERAKELLRDPALSLADVALACGFGDQSHFTRTFTAVVRLSPGLWRRMQSQRLPMRGSSPRH